MNPNLDKTKYIEMEAYYTLFLSFLRSEGCERTFMENFYLQNRCTAFCRDVWDIMGGDEYFLNRAFRWDITSQGRDYWKEIDRRWEKAYMKRWNAGRKNLNDFRIK